jgi:hypothetical protein
MLVNCTCSETSETESLVHPAGVVVTVMTHDGTARPVLSVSQHLAKLRMAQLGSRNQGAGLRVTTQAIPIVAQA